MLVNVKKIHVDEDAIELGDARHIASIGMGL